eukprot:1196390-Prorocentrum_minimum.AAC.3
MGTGHTRGCPCTGACGGPPPPNQPHLWRTMWTKEVVMWTLRATTGSVRATVSTGACGGPPPSNQPHLWRTM